MTIVYLLLLMLILVANFVLLPKMLSNFFIEKIYSTNNKVFEFYLDLFVRYGFFVKKYLKNNPDYIESFDNLIKEYLEYKRKKGISLYILLLLIVIFLGLPIMLIIFALVL